MDSNNPSIAVVILNWNGQHWLEQFLSNTIKHSKDVAATYVIDNGSTDGSVAWLQTHFPEVELVNHTKNLGFAGGYHEGLKQINADYYVLLNSDVEVTPYWLSALIDTFRVYEDVAVVQPKILDYNRKDLFEHAGACGGYMDKYGYTFCRGRLFNAVEQDRGQYDSIQEIFWASGACMMIRSEDYHRSGGLDHDFFAHMEEIDLCWRLQHGGRKIFINPNSVVYHVGGGTLAYSNPHKTFLNYRNNLIMLYKNLPTNKLFSIIFTRLILDGFSGGLALIQGRFRDILAIIRAHLTFFGGMKKWRSKRYSLNTVRSEAHWNELIGFYNQSVVWKFFVQGIKSFEKLNIPEKRLRN